MSQAGATEQIRSELADAGHGVDQVQFVGVNDKTAAANQAALLAVTTFPFLQDTAEVDAWGQHGGGKDDFILYDAAGHLYAFLPYGGAVDIDLGSAPAYDALKALIVEAILAP